MVSGSFFKELVQKSCISFFRTFFVGLAIIFLIVFISLLGKKPPQGTHTTTAVALPTHDWKQKDLSRTTPTIILIEIKGEIGLKNSLTKETIRQQLMDTIDGEIKIGQVKGLALFINSPGGTVDDSDAIYRLIREYKTRYKIPVWAFVEGMCASGGVYIASSADKIIATEDSIIGSVGVIMGPAFNFSALMDKVGVQSKTITAGKDKDMLNPFRPWQPEDGKNFQEICDSNYQLFLSIVSAARPKLTKETLIDLGAQVFSATKARDLGYIDEVVDNRDVALKNMATFLGIEKNYQLVRLQTKTWFEDLFEYNALFKGKIEHTIKLSNFPAEFAGKPLYLYCPELQN